MVYESFLDDTVLIRDNFDKQVLIVSRKKGYLGVDLEDIPQLIEELQCIEEDLRRFAPAEEEWEDEEYVSRSE